ncbi:bifunctional DNA primase/polymerase [Dactylosporangium aurantiacum]|uniref:Bifunctional DNA primase/polymerase n=2 Tax=Dactylosporangium aurantiacum TaxID=35754 RepID=A0A9Q9IDR5_9ACTN|nr:bifunctional DNA primase/polymerase [Dactylosporangium aurantiacum]
MTTTAARCGFWIAADQRHCGTTDGTRTYLPGERCPQHTPAALAGRPEPPSASITGETEMELRPASQALLRNAIRYAEHGWPVFLLGRTKRPLANCDACKDAGAEHDPAACDCLTCHGFYAATTDRQRIEAMCEAYPRGMLAIRTGAVADLAVVDIDPRNGGALDPALMPRTACVATGGGGWHLYYRHPGGRLAPEVADHPGVDLKADGGYVVAPPSIHPRTGQPYRWIGSHPVIEMAPALVALCRPRETLTVAAPTSPTTARRAGAISSPDALLASILGAVGRAPKGGHRRALYGAARGVARMVAAGAIDQADAVAALTATGREHGQTDREIREAIKGGFRAERVPVAVERRAA